MAQELPKSVTVQVPGGFFTFLVTLAHGASCLVVVAVGGLVAVMAKASVVVTFFFRCSHATCRFVVSCSSSSHSEESSSPYSEQIPSFLQD